MASKVDVYLQLLETDAAPKDKKEVKQYVNNLLQGLADDIKAQTANKDLAEKINDEIKLRF